LDTDAAGAHPAPGVKSLRNKLHFTVMGWEEVKVPAGTFKALKIETGGNWFREFGAVGPQTSSTGVVQHRTTPALESYSVD
jgi:hypothetical protein